MIPINIAGEEAHRLDGEDIIKLVSEALNKMYPDFDAEKSIVDYKIKKWTDGIVVYLLGLLSHHQEAIRAKENYLLCQ
ncbi:MAG: hypothetical protein AAFR90_13590 [Pseudomonadota bacterium]